MYLMLKESYEPYIETFSGIKFHFLDPREEEIDIDDIAHALSNQCRYNGHCSYFYSVAEHSVLVASLLPNNLRLAGLLHDGAEAYLSDIPSPVKKHLRGYNEMESKILFQIQQKFGVYINDKDEELIKEADIKALKIEANFLLNSRGTGEAWEQYKDLKIPNKRIMCAPPALAKEVFIDAFKKFTNTEQRIITIA